MCVLFYLFIFLVFGTYDDESTTLRYFVNETFFSFVPIATTCSSRPSTISFGSRTSWTYVPCQVMMSRLGAQRIGMEGMEKEVAARVREKPCSSIKLRIEIATSAACFFSSSFFRGKALHPAGFCGDALPHDMKKVAM